MGSFEVSTSTRDSTIASQIYKDCSVFICGHYTMNDSMELDMNDVDVVMDMD
ncbi:hypothetical protein [Corynebacterium parakroppenstedtii]|uniref:hypothetical protein n=1 Tax=Corynebacterium parakroppenstedtii TaxID=2828363 RepID=UPI0034DD4A18